MRKILNKKVFAVLVVVLSGLAVSSVVYSHCQIPCGIYDDDMRFDMMSEHITTIEKSMNQIIELSAAEKSDYNQLVRWVNNKDHHADELSEIITYYFMAQRVAPVGEADSPEYKKYVGDITALHRMLVLAMKAKQDIDLKLIPQLAAELAAYKKSYFSQREEALTHTH